MNIDEKNPSQIESVEENNEIQEPKKSGLPLGALIGIIGGAVAVIVAVVLIILLSGNKSGTPCEHVDADDDYLCDRCGEHFDDGDEAADIVDKVDVSFIVKFEDGSVLSGAKFVLTRNDQTYEFVSGADGSVKGTVKIGKYYLDFDHETIPEYCLCNTPGLDIKEDTTIVELVIVDNRPDGSAKKPFPVTTTTVDLEIGAGQEFYYSCHGANTKYLTIISKDIIVKYNGETYHSPVDGKIKVTISSSSVDTPVIFSVKNVSDTTVKTTMEIVSPPGSDDNPIKITQNNLTAIIPNEKTVYYVYTAEENGVLVVDGRTVGISISITRYITRVIDNNGEEQEIIIPVLTSANDDSSSYTYIRKGEQVKIGVSFGAPKNITVASNDDQIDASLPYVVDFGVNVYAGDESDPAPIRSSNISLLLDEGSVVVFSADIGKTIEISDAKLSLVCNGNTVQPSGDGKIKLTLSDTGLFSIKNNHDGIVNSNLEAISPEGTENNPIPLENGGVHITIPSNKTIYYSYTSSQSGAFAFSGYIDGCEISLTRKIFELVKGNESYSINLSYVSTSTVSSSPVYLYTLAGDVIVVAISNNNDTDVELDLTYSITEGKTPYTVTVKDLNNNPISNVEILFTVEEENVYLVTNSDGRVTYLSDKNVNISVNSLPIGYVVNKQLFDKYGNLTVELILNPIVIKVVDQYGNPVARVTLQAFSSDGVAFIPKTTNANGEVSYPRSIADYDCRIRINCPDGYTLPDGNDVFAIVESTLTIVLTKNS